MKKNIVHLNSFEGPLDLLLFLISKNEIDIYDIPISEITNQYLEYIYQMNELNIEVASEFIVMASTLLELKSKTLLPKEEDEDEEIEDPRDALVRKLIEYKAFKELSRHLKERERAYNKTFTKDPEYYPEITDEVIIKNIDLELLSKAMRAVLTRHKARLDEFGTGYSIETEVFSVDDRILDITTLLETNEKLNFFSLLPEKEVSKKGYVISTFLAILELLKLNMVELDQENNYDDIIVKKL